MLPVVTIWEELTGRRIPMLIKILIRSVCQNVHYLSLIWFPYSHVTREGVENARKLCQSLIDTVKREFEQFKSSQTGPLGFGATPHHYTSNTGRLVIIQ